MDSLCFSGRSRRRSTNLLFLLLCAIATSPAVSLEEEDTPVDQTTKSKRRRTTRSSIQITEFLASNDGVLLDEDGDSSDWLELYNSNVDASAASVDLGGLILRDDGTEWTIPIGTVLESEEYRIVFLSDKDRTDPTGELHANFKLGADGDFLGLFEPDGTVLSAYADSSRANYPAQLPDRSYGVDSAGLVGFFSTPTPGQPNGLRDTAITASDLAVQASVERGFYDSPFTVELVVASSSGEYVTPATTAGMEIKYTLDGSDPATATSSMVYTTPLTVSTTTVLRTNVQGLNQMFSSTSTITYIFLNDVIQQPSQLPGFPTSDVMQETELANRAVPFDTEMDPEVVSVYEAELLEGLRSIPTFAISASLDDLFGPEGILLTDVDREVPVSLEVFHSASSTTEQVPVGLESHSHIRNKQGLRINFRSRYGQREWATSFLKDHIPVNQDSTVSESFRTFVVRSGNNRSWSRSWEPDLTSYTEDQLYRSTQIDMTGSGSHGTFVHLYLNGAYWGLYNLSERPDEEFQASYNDGDADDWFFTTHAGAGSADTTRWYYLLFALAPRDMDDPTNFAEMQEYLNVEQFCDYLIVSFWIGMTDWIDNNWYSANRNDASPLGPTPTEFFAWDGEATLDRKRDEPLQDYRNRPPQGASIPFDFLCNGCSIEDGNQPILILWYSLWYGSEAFRTLFDERVAFHTRPGGALTDAAAIQRWNDLTDYIRSAVIGESARWGDSLKTLEDRYPGNTYGITKTRDGDWQPHVDQIRDILDGNMQRFLEQYDLLVNPSVRWRLLSKFPKLRRYLIRKEDDEQEGFFSGIRSFFSSFLP